MSGLWDRDAGNGSAESPATGSAQRLVLKGREARTHCRWTEPGSVSLGSGTFIFFYFPENSIEYAWGALPHARHSMKDFAFRMSITVHENLMR